MGLYVLYKIICWKETYLSNENIGKHHFDWKGWFIYSFESLIHLKIIIRIMIIKKQKIMIIANIIVVPSHNVK